MADEQFIELVRSYEAVYNTKCAEYRDATSRNAAWGEIAQIHGKTVEECKEIWNKLRNCYNNAMKRRQRKGDQASKHFAPWRYEQQMSFLRPYLGGRINTVNPDDDTEFEEVPVHPIQFQRVKSESQISNDSFNNRSCSPASNSSFKRKASCSSDGYLPVTIEMMKTPQENRMKMQEMDDLDTFFLSMSKTVKKLPKRDQIRIKMDLLKAVSDAELKQEAK